MGMTRFRKSTSITHFEIREDTIGLAQFYRD